MSMEILAEVEGVELGDRRLDERCRQLMQALATDPQASVHAACQGWAETQAAYRFFDNPKVTPEKILRPHQQATRERMAQHPVVLAVQDTTELDFSAHPPAGAGPLSYQTQLGFLDHTLLAVTPEQVPLGVLDVRLSVRTAEGFGGAKGRQHEPLETKETYRWLQGYRTACTLAGQLPETQIVSVADSEGDLYEVLVEAEQHPTPAEYVLRAGKDRSLPERDAAAEGETFVKLRQRIATAPVAARRELHLRATPKRAPRVAAVEVRAETLELKAPYRQGTRLPGVRVGAVWVRESGPPEGVEPIDWLLLTSLPLDTEAEVLQVVAYYAARWAIEVYFRVLKTGCRVEDVRLETAERLRPCLMLYRIIAWRVLYVTRLGRACPDLPCDVLFTAAEWKSVCRIVRPAAASSSPPTLQEFTRLLGELGGHSNRRGDGPPGPQALWTGLRRMTDFAHAWHAFGPEAETRRCV